MTSAKVNKTLRKSKCFDSLNKQTDEKVMSLFATTADGTKLITFPDVEEIKKKS